MNTEHWWLILQIEFRQSRRPASRFTREQWLYVAHELAETRVRKDELTDRATTVMLQPLLEAQEGALGVPIETFILLPTSDWDERIGSAADHAVRFRT